MSKSVFPPKPQTPLFAIRSCIADKANTVNRTEFENLKLTVDVAKAKCNEIVSKTNDIIKTTNIMTILYDKMFTAVYPTGTVVYSSMEPKDFMMFQPGYGVWGYFSGNWAYSTTPVQEIEFEWFDPLPKDATTSPSFEELQNRKDADAVETGTGKDAGADAGAGTVETLSTTTPDKDDGTVPTPDQGGESEQNKKPAETVVGNGLKHKRKIQIYAYWCQYAEEVNQNLPEEPSEIPEIKD